MGRFPDQRSVTRCLALVLSMMSAAGSSEPASGQWLLDGNRVCPTGGYQNRCELISDGHGGALIAWEDGRVPGNDVYCSRFNGSGKLAHAWPDTGVPLCTASGYQGAPMLVSDGAEGAIVAWLDGRDQIGDGAYHVFAQRVVPSGKIAAGWPVDGVALCRGSGGFPKLAPDGSGGAFAVWSDRRNTDYNHDIYAQHVSGTGALFEGWPANGFGVNTSVRDDISPTAMLYDGAGGAFVVWNSFVGSDLFAQRITSSGTLAPGWPADGLVVASAPSNQLDPSVVTDDKGGCYLTWYDARSDDGDVYAQRITAAGTVVPGWEANGVPVCTAAFDQHPTAIVDVPIGVVIVWTDRRNGTNYQFYAQCLTPAGTVAPGWPISGLCVCPSAGDQHDAVLVSDRAGGVIVAWTDARRDAGDIYAQRLTANGTVANDWPAAGVLVCTADGFQYDPAITTDDAGGALITWTDTRSGDASIYLARVTVGGLTGPAIPVPPLPTRTRLIAVRPNPMRDQATIVFRLPAPAKVRAEVIDVAGRLVAIIASNREFEEGEQILKWDGRKQSGQNVRSGIYTIRLTTRHGSDRMKVVLVR